MTDDNNTATIYVITAAVSVINSDTVSDPASHDPALIMRVIVKNKQSTLL
ncbi:MAG: hypothetical protein LKF79_01080 [Solobacterium sp.]|jgi:hypothetical protein|nr:hypothetical protein [Solobacterium sp.]